MYKVEERTSEDGEGVRTEGRQRSVALMSISFGFGVLSVLRLRHAQIAR